MRHKLRRSTAAARPQPQRQRQRLIDACISALHIYGPSRTTVEKVVALADLSPGIVRFYFDSKAVMLLASLEYLAMEFAERVMAPVVALRETPAQALRLLVELYLDAQIASPRKVSVWYSFWGEASSRQEYLDICGTKDEEFAAVVRDLVSRLISTRGESYLDADGVSLGLIGVLEVLWQGIAFQNEADIDRAAAVERALAYLRSVFPGEFAAAGAASARRGTVGRRPQAKRAGGAGRRTSGMRSRSRS
ncbi:MAG TPA: TetR/AcrR family transcriptional regulator [Steroidobacteraceae bacterium]|nr:TetR/AcrR family transcriptional regulator [Steroidobacteraceae bacterium]